MSNLSILTNAPAKLSEPTLIEDALALHVRTEFIEAENYRRVSGIEERLLRALRARRYEYDPGDAGLIGGVDVYMGLTALKCRAAASWINDILLNSIDKPWTIKPTPIPELPEWLKEQVVDALTHELQQAGAPLDIRQRAKELKDVALKYAQRKSQDAVAAMELKLEDQFLEGGWRTAFAEFVDDLCTFPAAFLRTPVIRKECRLAWDGNALVEREEIIYTTRRISPFDAYPSLDSNAAGTGRFFIERRQLAPHDLYMMLGLEGFNDDALREVLNQYADTGYQQMLTPDWQRQYLEDKALPVDERKTIDSLLYNGKIQGKLLINNGILVPDAQGFYETEIWTVNNRTIKAVLNPYPLRQRPIFSTSFVKVPGSLWGEGMCDILRDVQRIVNSAARSIVRNMGYSSGPIGEVDVARLGDGESPTEMIPYRLYHVDSDPMGSGKPAFAFHQVPNVAPQLMDVMDRYMKMADDLSGVPAYVLGNPQVAGAGRTMGGLSMMMGNAAKGIKNVILNADRDVIERAVEFQYNINMVNSDDPDIKADAQVISRGATGLLQREMAQSRMVEMLQTYLPFVQMGLITPDGAKVMVRESMKLTGLPIDEIMPDPNRISQLQAGLGRLGVADALQTGSSNPPPLDGRSAVPPFPQQSLPPQSPGFPAPPQAQMPTNLPQGA